MVTNAIKAIVPKPAGWDDSIQKWQAQEKNKQPGDLSD